ncbi:MAG: malonyl-CoA decarboxylase [Gammaproteobacteria bacterium]|nr:malonyl-CoA decarboxylase [Gammaproteobacteria bacterium]
MSEATFLNRTLRQFRRVLRLAGSGEVSLRERVGADLPDADIPAIKNYVDACLEGRGGEVSASARAAELGEVYLTLSQQGRRRFLTLLAREYDVPANTVAPLVEAWQNAPDATTRWQVQDQLRHALIPSRVTLLRQFTALSAGVKFLVDMRAELTQWSRGDKPLAALNRDLRELLAEWFNVGFLDLRQMTWNTSAALLEKLIVYEAVHAIRSWDDLKNRLGEDRRVYAFFHPGMPNEPLIFVQVALVRDMSGNIQTLLDEDAPVSDPREADCAIFYSISNCQAGLAGVSFGNFLIKRVAAALARDLPNLKIFATLSPVPGFSAWLRAQTEQPGYLWDEGEVPEALRDHCGHGDWNKAIAHALDNTEWAGDEPAAQALRPVLAKACARYLLQAKRGNQALDRVAHFHLTNGARVERLNWLADTSEQGMKRSAGLMVNYQYRLDEVDENHEAYSGEGRIAAAAPVSRLLRGAR